MARTKELTKAEKFYIERNTNKDPDELASDIGCTKAKVQKYLDELFIQKKKKSKIGDFAKDDGGKNQAIAATSAVAEHVSKKKKPQEQSHIFDPRQNANK